MCVVRVWHSIDWESCVRVWVHDLAPALACYCVRVSVNVNRNGWGARVVALGRVYMEGGAVFRTPPYCKEFHDNDCLSVLAY